MPTTDLDYQRLPFTEALEYLQGKLGDLDTESFLEGLGPIQDVAFTVAMAKGALLQEIRTATEEAIQQGQSVRDFTKTFEQIQQRWVAAGNDWELRGSTGWRANIIYQTNLATAYASGRFQQMRDTAKSRPFWQWRHGETRHPRPSHLALDRKVFPSGSPFWDTMFPPVGFGCKCEVYSLNQRDLDRLGLTVEDPPEIGTSLPVEVDGKTYNATIQPDRGFDFVPGQSTPEQRQRMLEQLDPDLKAMVEAGNEPNNPN